MKKIYISILGMLCAGTMISQSFTENTNLVSAAHHSGGCTGVTDMNNDGLDDIVILDQSVNLKIAYQQADGTFQVSDFGDVSNESQWGMCIGDIDNDGHKDVMCGGSYDNVHILNINGPGDYDLINYPWADIFMQGSNLSDVNNDGWLDGFACHDDGHNVILENDGTGAMSDGTYMMDMVFYPETNGNDNSGNYGSVWTDFDRDGDTDLFIAKCRQFISEPLDPRRTNILMINDGNGNFTEHAQDRGLVNLQQSWTSDFADMDNDGDFDVLLTTHSNTLEIYENDGTGYFTNITAGSGLEYGGFFLQAKMVDFDNDGFVDLVHSGGDHRFFHNNGDMTFTLVNNMFPADDVMHSFGIGDLNHDGYLDLYASYGDNYVTPDNGSDDRIFINDGGDNGFIVFDLEGTISNMDAAGAIVEIHGAWGVQIREVRDGESYGITNQSMCHFGLGSATEIDEAIIYWPSGTVTNIDNPAINTWYNVVEGQCFLAAPTISAVGSATICPGGTAELTVNEADITYSWSNGEITQTITVSEPGNYFVTVSDGNGCEALSQGITIAYESQEPPTISANGDLHICDNASVILTASEGNSYLWSNGETTQSIAVSESGDYTVDVALQCSTVSSDIVTVETSAAPAAPAVSNVEIQQNETATFTVTGGSNIQWYDNPFAITPIATGPTYTTPELTSTSTYWVEDVMVYDGGTFTGGKTDLTDNGDGQYQNNSTYYLLFDALEDVTITSVKVYANGDADRTIAVIDAMGNTIATGTFTIPDGESVVELNFFVPQGAGYGIRCVGNSPQLWRDKDLTNGFDFPFNIGNQVTITNTSVQGNDSDNYYYYFYDWQVDAPDFTCISERVEVQAIIAGVGELEQVTDMRTYPNPASDRLTISFNSLISSTMQLSLLDQTGRIVAQKQINSNTGLNNHNLDLSNVATGIYQLRIAVNGKSVSEKIVVE